MKKLISIMFILFLAVAAFAQSAEKVDEILETEKVTYGQISYLSAIHQNLIGDDASYEDAVAALVTARQLPEGILPDTVISVEKMSYLYLKMWPKVKGGFMCRITKGSARYAYKQLKEDGIVSQYSDPWDTLSGFEAMNILSSCMRNYAAEDERVTLDDIGMDETEDESAVIYADLTIDNQENNFDENQIEGMED